MQTECLVEGSCMTGLEVECVFCSWWRVPSAS